MDIAIALDGGSDELVPVSLGSFTLPSRPGVLLPVTPTPNNPLGLDFIASHPFPPERTARGLSQQVRTRFMVLCPRLVSPAGTRLAVAVARLLAEQRPLDDRTPVITCAVRPACAWESGAVIVPHLVSLVLDGAVQTRVVWELLDPRHIVRWYDSVDLERIAPTTGAW